MKSTINQEFTTRIGLAVLALALVAGSPLSAQEIAHTQFFPILARTAGAGGTQWVTDLTVHNHSDSDLVVGVQFLEADKANVFNPSLSRPVHARGAGRPCSSRMCSTTLFGFETDIKGAMVVTVDPTARSGFQQPGRFGDPRHHPDLQHRRPGRHLRSDRSGHRQGHQRRADKIRRHRRHQQHPVPFQPRRHEHDLHRRRSGSRYRVLNGAGERWFRSKE